MKTFIKYFVIPFVVGYLLACFLYDDPNGVNSTSKDNSGYSVNQG